MSARQLRALVALGLAGWAAIGLWGASLYVQRYVQFRGFPAPRTPAGVAQGSVRAVSFRSRALGRSDRYLVYLPPGYAAQAARGRRFPVLYLLHGYPGTWNVFLNVGAAHVDVNVLIAEHRMPPTILVMPAGLQGMLHGDTEWANAGAGPWMDFVIDVVHDVDRRFATQADRQHRGIAGDSEGAYGATNVALHHLGVFSVLESWSGYFTQTRTSVFSDASATDLRDNSPAQYVDAVAPAIRRLGLRAWLFQGRTETSSPALLQGFADELHRAGAEVHVGFFPGGHDWGLWRAQLPRMLTAAGHWFEQSPRATAGFSQVGQALPDSVLKRILADRRRLCLALRPGPGVRIGRSCRRYRARHPDAVRAAARGSAPR